MSPVTLTYYLVSFSILFVVVVQSVSGVELFATAGAAWSTPGFPILHNLSEFAQTHVH